MSLSGIEKFYSKIDKRFLCPNGHLSTRILKKESISHKIRQKIIDYQYKPIIISKVKRWTVSTSSSNAPSITPRPSNGIRMWK